MGTPYSEAAAEILEEIRLRNADLVVMATHGRSGLGRWLYGSVADEVLHRSPVVVVVVSATSGEFRSPDKLPSILVPLDGSRLAEASLAPAAELASQLGASLVLLNVVALPAYGLYGEAGGYIDPDAEVMDARQYLARIAQSLRPRLNDVRVRAEIGNPADCIVQVATDEGATLIVMATHRHTGLARAVLGSVATSVLRRGTIQLMLVPPALEGTRAEPTTSDAPPLESSFQEGPVVHVALSRSDLDLLQRGLGELLYKPGGDPECCPQVRKLADRLKRVESNMAAEFAVAKG